MSALVQLVDEPYRSGFQRILTEHGERLRSARGSSRNHQAWKGGYLDHVQEVMNIAVVLHDTLGGLRPLDFSLSDALAVLFVHDMEKPWAYEEVDGVCRRREGFASKNSAHAFRLDRCSEAGITLPAHLERAVAFTEGEAFHYSNMTRGMSPLAAFCNMCDVASARLWHDHPQKRGDSWGPVRRSCQC
jgi:hypothetical protein